MGGGVGERRLCMERILACDVNGCVTWVGVGEGVVRHRL